MQLTLCLKAALNASFSAFIRRGFQPCIRDNWRRKGGRFQEAELDANLTLIEQLKSIAQRYHRPLSHLAIAWVLRRPEITSAIVGARRPGQISQTAGAADWQLPEAVIQEIDRALAQRDAALGDHDPSAMI